jgi:hypothetical protein
LKRALPRKGVATDSLCFERSVEAKIAE